MGCVLEFDELEVDGISVKFVKLLVLKFFLFFKRIIV